MGTFLLIGLTDPQNRWKENRQLLIPFNKPYLTGKETAYIQEAVCLGKLSGNGSFTKKCQAWLEQRFGFRKALLTSSCTDALEMAAILLDIQPGDEVIIPSYTFVSTANAFVLRGARIVFADSTPENPNLDASTLEALITPRTRALVPVHYAGIACDMDAIMALASRHNLFVVEDAAHAIDGYYTGADGVKRALGSIGHLGTFSFHETKNIIAGEGGMLAINDERFLDRAENIWEKGTNRNAFFRGEVNKYDWVDIGSSFLPSEIMAAFLWAQLEQLDQIQARRIAIWQKYCSYLKELTESGMVQLPLVPAYATHNGHMFYLVLESAEDRASLIDFLKEASIQPIFHYLPLHASRFYRDKYSGEALPWAEHYGDKLLRLPFFIDITDAEIMKVTRTLQAALLQQKLSV